MLSGLPSCALSLLLYEHASVGLAKHLLVYLACGCQGYRREYYPVRHPPACDLRRQMIDYHLLGEPRAIMDFDHQNGAFLPLRVMRTDDSRDFHACAGSRDVFDIDRTDPLACGSVRSISKTRIL